MNRNVKLSGDQGWKGRSCAGLKRQNVIQIPIYVHRPTVCVLQFVTFFSPSSSGIFLIFPPRLVYSQIPSSFTVPGHVRARLISNFKSDGLQDTARVPCSMEHGNLWRKQRQKVDDQYFSFNLRYIAARMLRLLDSKISGRAVAYMEPNMERREIDLERRLRCVSCRFFHTQSTSFYISLNRYRNESPESRTSSKKN